MATQFEHSTPFAALVRADCLAHRRSASLGQELRLAPFSQLLMLVLLKSRLLCRQIHYILL